MAYVTKEEIARAKEMDLFTYLSNFEPYELIHISGQTYCTREHDSLKISNGKWHWFSRGIGGRSALDYLIKVRGYPFTSAVETILNKGPASMVQERQVLQEERKLVLPELSNKTDNVKKYLMNRGIDSQIIDWCIENKLIFESKEYANAIFVGYDHEGQMRYAAMRGTRSKYKGDAKGSDKSFSFFIAEKASKNLHVFESAIDLLSYATMRKLNGLNWKEDNLLSLAGVYVNKGRSAPAPKALDRFLNDNPDIGKIHLHLDSDDIGRGAAISLKSILSEKYEVEIQIPECGKDVNDELMAKLSRKDRSYDR